jgi:hypothetical protein
MEPARPLRDVFADLVTDEDVRRAHAADPEGFLQAQGHTELPEQLVSEAIVNYADTAPAEVAEHLAPFVMAHSPVPAVSPDGPAADADGLQLLATAPVELHLDDLPDDAPDGVALATDPAGADGGADDPFDLDFGHGELIDDVPHVPGAAGEASDPDSASAAGPLPEAQADDAFTDLAAGHAAGQLEPATEDAAGWLDSDPRSESDSAPGEDITDL